MSGLDRFGRGRPRATPRLPPKAALGERRIHAASVKLTSAERGVLRRDRRAGDGVETLKHTRYRSLDSCCDVERARHAERQAEGGDDVVNVNVVARRVPVSKERRRRVTPSVHS